MYTADTLADTLASRMLHSLGKSQWPGGHLGGHPADTQGALEIWPGDAWDTAAWHCLVSFGFLWCSFGVPLGCLGRRFS